MESTAARVDAMQGDLLSRMVASSQITELSEQLSQIQNTEQPLDEKSAQEVLMTQALGLALKYQLVTDQTNLLLVHIREEAKKAEGLPTLDRITHMQAAGWGGVGSVVPVSDQVQFSRRVDSPLMNACASSVGTTDYDSITMPSVWRNRTFAAAAPSISALSSTSMDAFEIPTFLRKQADSVTDKVRTPASPPVSSPVLREKSAKPVSRALSLGPLATPLELLQAFEKSSQKLVAPHRFVRDLQALHLPPELTKLLDDLTVILGSGAKAWTLMLQWLAEKLNDHFTLSRQSERLLRHTLKDEDAQKLQEMLLTMAEVFEQTTPDDWHLASTMAT